MAPKSTFSPRPTPRCVPGGVVGAPHEGLEGALALLGQQRLDPARHARPLAGACSRAPRRAGGPEAVGPIV